MRRLILGGIVLAAFAGAGCEVETRSRPIVVGAEFDVGPHYAYYERGSYVGPHWVWRDHEGREYREERAVHERRIRERGEHHGEHHEEHH